MTKFNGLAIAALFAGALTLPALAIEPQENPEIAPHEHTGTTMQLPTQGFSQPQQVSGSVTEIDMSKGLVELSAKTGNLKLHFPPQSVHGLKKGDVITAQYAFAKGQLESGRAYDAPKNAGEHRMTGTISKIDHAKGDLYVKTEHTTLELRFPPQQVQDLKQGDQITVELGFTKGA